LSLSCDVFAPAVIELHDPKLELKDATTISELLVTDPDVVTERLVPDPAVWLCTSRQLEVAFPPISSTCT
jgi:hypothetical protein